MVIWLKASYLYDSLQNNTQISIDQKGIVFFYDFANLFSFSSSLFLVGKRKGEKNNQSRGKKQCPSARS